MSQQPRSVSSRSARFSPRPVSQHVARIAGRRWMCCKQRITLSVVSSAFSSFVAFIFIGSFLAQQPLLSAQVAPQQTPRVRHRSVKPMITGTDGTQTGIADFFGNFTTITTSSGAALALGRESNCSLTLATGTYSIEPFMYTQTELTSNYELVLHSEAQLTTTPDVFASGCAIQPPAGFGSRPAVFVGLTTSGVYVYAGLGITPPSFVNGVYLMAGTTSFSLSSFQDSSAGNLTAADLNKDGNGDLVILDNAVATTGRVTVMLGNADGTFKNGVVYPIAGNYSVAAVIDDVNGDGNLDIVAVSGDQQISVLLGNGDGTFQAAQSFAAPALPGNSSAATTPIVNLITADLRGNGKKDIVCSNGLVLLGNGNGTFAAVATPAFPYFQDPLFAGGPNLASGDVNNDGKIDLVLDNGSNISTWIGKGDGTFTQGQSYATINSDGFISVGDLDGDGSADIFVGLGDGGVYAGDGGSPNLSYALMGNGNGTFQGAPQIGFGAYTGNNLADVTGSGTLDLITNTVDTPYGYPDTTVPTFTVQLGTGKGTFTPTSTVTAPASFVLNGTTITGANTTGASTFAVADINGDGKADLVFADNGLYSGGGSQYPLPVYFTAISNGDGTFQAPVPIALQQIAPAAGFDNSDTVSGLEITNLKKGGDASLIYTFNETAGGPGVNPYNEGFAILPGNGNGTFQAPVITTTYSSATAPFSAIAPQIIAIADLNGDGNPDLLVNVPGTVVTNFQLQNQLELFLGNGDGTFKTPTVVNVGADVYGIPVVEDLNKDGKLDLALLAETSAGQAEIVIALGNGDGTFGTPAILDLSDGDAIRNSSLAAADFNADGNIDLALFDSNAFSGIFYGNGDGTFTSVNTGTTAAPSLIPQDLMNLSLSGPAVAANLTAGAKPDILVGNTTLLNLYGSVTSPTPVASSTALAASAPTIAAGASVTFTATVTGPTGNTTTPTGAVTFMDGTTTLGNGTLSSSGVATYTTTALPTGSDSITAVYGGDTNFSGSTSSAVTVTVTAAPTPSFALTNSGNITVSPGATTGNSSTISVAPSGGFTGAVALTCAIAPAAASDPATCALSPASVTISGATAGTSVLTLTTTAATTAALVHPKLRRAPWYAAGGATLACVLLLVMPTRRRRWRTMLGMIVLFAFLAVGLLSCGGGGGTSSGGGGGTSNPGTTAGSYTVTVTGTAGSTTETTTVTLTVN